MKKGSQYNPRARDIRPKQLPMGPEMTRVAVDSNAKVADEWCYRNNEANPMRTATLIVTLGLIACGGAQEKSPKTVNVDTLTKKDARSFDINHDGVADVWKYYVKTEDGDYLARKEFDINFDGTVDIWRYYAPGGALIRDRMDMDFDGKIDVTSHYENGQVVRKELDLEFDERPDLVKYYENGVIIRIEGDSDNDGNFDYWEYYKEGKLARAGTDEDGDGQPDPDKWRTPE